MILTVLKKNFHIVFGICLPSLSSGDDWGGSISCRWRYLSRMIACRVFHYTNLFLSIKTRHFISEISVTTNCWFCIWRSLIMFSIKFSQHGTIAFHKMAPCKFKIFASLSFSGSSPLIWILNFQWDANLSRFEFYCEGEAGRGREGGGRSQTRRQLKTLLSSEINKFQIFLLPML